MTKHAQGLYIAYSEFHTCSTNIVDFMDFYFLDVLQS